MGGQMQREWTLVSTTHSCCHSLARKDLGDPPPLSSAAHQAHVSWPLSLHVPHASPLQLSPHVPLFSHLCICAPFSFLVHHFCPRWSFILGLLLKPLLCAPWYCEFIPLSRWDKALSNCLLTVPCTPAHLHPPAPEHRAGAVQSLPSTGFKNSTTQTPCSSLLEKPKQLITGVYICLGVHLLFKYILWANTIGITLILRL